MATTILGARSRALAAFLSLAGMLAGAATAGANLLTDPGFELNPLLPGTGVLASIPGNAGIWGTENANIVGTVGAVSPAGGLKMLQMLDDGLIATQGWQAVNVSAWAGPIDAGLVWYSASAKYNVDSTVPAAFATTGVFFIDSTATWGNFTGPFANTGLTLDNNPATWETIVNNGMVPAGTRWMIFQVAYANATLIGTAGTREPGYVDDASLLIRVVPVPAAMLAGAPLLLMLGLRRRRTAQA